MTLPPLCPLGVDGYAAALLDQLPLKQRDADLWRLASTERTGTTPGQWDDARATPAGLPGTLTALADTGRDAYIALNTCRPFARRASENTLYLNGFFVDLDVQNDPALDALPRSAILARVLRDLGPDIPPPTWYVESGRGIYLIWLFDKPRYCGAKAPQAARRWSATQRKLVQLLRGYCADAHCTDPMRLLRIPDSRHSGSGKLVRYYWVGDGQRYPAAELTTRINAAHYAAFPPRPAARATRPRVDTAAVNSAPRKPARFTGLTLNQQRLQDYIKLAELREPMRDGRRRLLYCMAIALTWCRHDADEVAPALALITQFFSDSSRYGPALIERLSRSLARRMDEAMAERKRQGKPLSWDNDPRYRLRTETIIDLLRITPDEQRHMRVLISPAEKRRRLQEKRRQRGVKPRAQYLTEQEAKTETTRQQVLTLQQQGLSQRQIAAQAGVSQTHVRRILKTL